MRPAGPSDEDTVRILPRRGKRAAWPFALAAVLAIALGGSAAVWLLRPHAVPTAAVPTTPVPAPATPFEIVTASEQEIAEHVPVSLTVFRFAGNPRILVLDFASLTEQGRMLNRVAAFAEKAGLPHDRVLADAELDAALRERGDTVETFYFGHDYAAPTLLRFFATADRQGIELDGQEERLRGLLRQVGWFAPEANAGLISIPAAGTDPRITQPVRAGILRHELAHGEFFSNPGYAEYVRNFWLKELTPQERASVRAFLGKDEYDVRVEELMYNEMQAYLMFTRDPELFTPDMAGLTQGRLEVLQERFLAGMPAGWLRDAMADYQTSTWAK
ncbi:MAG TPA: hypothetical protein VH855_15720 [Acetobacteraceae bacterium]